MTFLNGQLTEQQFADAFVFLKEAQDKSYTFIAGLGIYIVQSSEKTSQLFSFQDFAQRLNDPFLSTPEGWALSTRSQVPESVWMLSSSFIESFENIGEELVERLVNKCYFNSFELHQPTPTKKTVAYIVDKIKSFLNKG